MRHIIPFLILLTYTCSHAAQPLEKWGLPDPETLIEASNTLCMDQAKSALLSKIYQTQGHSKEEVMALIPEAPDTLDIRLISAMKENVEDAFKYPDLSVYTLYSFRSETCMRETLEATRLPRLAAVYPALAECQKTHGTEKSLGLGKCIQGIVRSTDKK